MGPSLRYAVHSAEILTMCPSISPIPHMLNASSGFLLASSIWWSKLPSDVRAGLMKATQRLMKEQRVEIEKLDASLFDQVAQKGIQVHVQTPAEEADWEKALQAVYSEFTPMIGPDLVKETQQAVEKLLKK